MAKGGERVALRVREPPEEEGRGEAATGGAEKGLRVSTIVATWMGA